MFVLQLQLQCFQMLGAGNWKAAQTSPGRSGAAMELLHSNNQGAEVVKVKYGLVTALYHERVHHPSSSTASSAHSHCAAHDTAEILAPTGSSIL